MKKTYIEPKATAVEVQLEGIMTNDSVTVTDTTVDPSKALSKEDEDIFGW